MLIVGLSERKCNYILTVDVTEKKRGQGNVPPPLRNRQKPFTVRETEEIRRRIIQPYMGSSVSLLNSFLVTSN